jgi:hypothetical protein
MGIYSGSQIRFIIGGMICNLYKISILFLIEERETVSVYFYRYDFPFYLGYQKNDYQINLYDSLEVELM